MSRVSGKGGLECTAYSSISDLYINAMFLLAYFDLVIIIQFSPRKDRDPPLLYFPWSFFIFCSMGTKSSLSLTPLKRDHLRCWLTLLYYHYFSTTLAALLCRGPESALVMKAPGYGQRL